MAEHQRLGAWGWFVRAFAAGFGVVFGIMTAAFVACIGTFGLQAMAAVVVDGGSINSTLAIDSPASISPIASAAYCAPTTPYSFDPYSSSEPVPAPTPNDEVLAGPTPIEPETSEEEKLPLSDTDIQELRETKTRYHAEADSTVRY